ncbi:MAG: DUF4375 domain-containing protein [Terrisporobacter sp.]|uniref:DMP19 family protein n=1 Tax=Terrisporobacter sp. TaxID=1965305 RepID=UPI002F93B84C
MALMEKILLIFVILGAIEIIFLLILKNKSKASKRKDEEKSKSHDIKILSYDDEDLVCMVDNNLELEYGYRCEDKETYKNMKKTHRNIYIIIWFETEMENGGLGEYLFNPSNITMDYLQEALMDIEAFDLSKEYKKFIEENNIANSINKIKKRNVQEYSQFMSQFDFSYFNNLYKITNLRKLMADYIRKNIVNFSDLSEEELRILKEIDEENLSDNN